MGKVISFPRLRPGRYIEVWETPRGGAWLVGIGPSLGLDVGDASFPDRLEALAHALRLHSATGLQVVDWQYPPASFGGAA